MDSPIRGRLLAGLLGVGLTLLAPALAAADTPATCGNLQSKLNTATAGDTITLAGTCHNMSFSFIAGHVPVTLRAAAAGDGFDGGATNTPILSGGNIEATTISGLTFRNGNISDASGGGAAIRIDGTSAPTIQGNTFLGNESPGSFGSGGAVSFNPSTTEPIHVLNNTFGSVTEGNEAFSLGGALYVNTAGAIVVSGNSFVGNHGGIFGGAVMLNALGAATVTDNTFQANRLTGNGSDGEGGGLMMSLNLASATYEVSRNRFIENTIDGTGDRHGGGLAIFTQSLDQATVKQSDNVFDENVIASGAGDVGGGAEWIFATKVNSTHDVFISNTIQAADGEGGGVGVEGVKNSSSVFVPGELHAVNLVADGNRLAGGGLGGGIYAGGPIICSPSPDCPSVLELTNSTVAGNCIDGTGTAPGIGGSADDQLTLRNAIVHNSGGASPCGGTAVSAPDIGGFTAAHVNATFSDVCTSAGGAGAALTGAGNICADPALPNSNFGDFHESAASPTVDAGSNALVPAGLTTDADGGARVVDGNHDGVLVSDMGADEFVPPAIAPGDTIKPRLSVLKQVLRANRKGKVRVRVRCTEQSRCIGRLTLTSVAKLAAKRKAKRLKLGSARFNIVGGKTARVTVKLSRRAFKVLKRKHSLKVVVALSGKDVAGNAAKSVKRTLKLKAPAKPKRHKR
jgi:hypothetical protein